MTLELVTDWSGSSMRTHGLAFAADVLAVTGSEHPDFDRGTAGASARREHQRRKESREGRVREQHRHLGGLLLALGGQPRHEAAWARGADGEAFVAGSLAKRLSDGVVVLHDRRIPHSRANIDHIAIASSGVWVVDAKRYKGKVAVRKPLFGEAKLIIAGRDKTRLIIGLERQVGAVRAVVADVSPETLVHGALCFVDADLPLVTKLSCNGYPLLYPKALAKRINARGPLSRSRVHELALGLAERFPAA